MKYDPFREPYAAATRVVLLDGKPAHGVAFARDGAGSLIVFNGIDAHGRPKLAALYGRVEVFHARARR